VDAAETEKGPVLVNSSRSILYASSGPDYAEAAAEAAAELRAALNG
jgi:orotidine-5'-phosphate decarboxylase